MRYRTSAVRLVQTSLTLTHVRLGRLPLGTPLHLTTFPSSSTVAPYGHTDGHRRVRSLSIAPRLAQHTPYAARKWYTPVPSRKDGLAPPARTLKPHRSAQSSGPAPSRLIRGPTWSHSTPADQSSNSRSARTPLPSPLHCRKSTREKSPTTPSFSRNPPTWVCRPTSAPARSTTTRTPTRQFPKSSPRRRRRRRLPSSGPSLASLCPTCPPHFPGTRRSSASASWASQTPAGLSCTAPAPAPRRRSRPAPAGSPSICASPRQTPTDPPQRALCGSRWTTSTTSSRRSCIACPSLRRT